MEVLRFNKCGQWSLEKGALRRLAPKPDPQWVQSVGGGSGSNYRPIEDPSHKERARHMLLNDMLRADPNRIKKIDGKVHVMLHRGLNEDNWHPEKITDTHVTHENTKFDPDTKEEMFGGNAYTTQHNWASSHGDPLSIWVPLDKIHNYSDYAYKMAGQSKFRHPSQDPNNPESFARDGVSYASETPLAYDKKTGKTQFKEDVHVYVGPGKFLRATPEEVQATTAKEDKGKPTDRSFQLKPQKMQSSPSSSSRDS